MELNTLVIKINHFCALAWVNVILYSKPQIKFKKLLNKIIY